MAMNHYLLCDFPDCDNQDADPYFIHVPGRGDLWADLCVEHSKAIKLLYYKISHTRNELRRQREEAALRQRSDRARLKQLRAELDRLLAIRPE